MGFKDFEPAGALGRTLKLYARRHGLKFKQMGGRYMVLAEEGGYARFVIKDDHQGVAVKYLLVGYDGERESSGKIAIYHGDRLNRGWDLAVQGVLDRIARAKGG